MRLGRRGERGNAMIEFALSFGLLFTVFGGVFQFGYAFYVYNTLESAVRSGARYASLRTYDSAYLTAVRNMVVYGNPAGGGQSVAPGLTPANVTVTPNHNVPTLVVVGITNYKIDGVLRSFTLTNKPQATFPYMGRWAP